MGRLINTDTVISFAKGEFGKDDLSKILWLISHVPTAYDVYKVVEQLEERKKYYDGKLNEQSGRNEDIGYWEDVKAYRDAIEIVKGGGINE